MAILQPDIEGMSAPVVLGAEVRVPLTLAEMRGEEPKLGRDGTPIVHIKDPKLIEAEAAIALEGFAKIVQSVARCAGIFTAAQISELLDAVAGINDHDEPPADGFIATKIFPEGAGYDVFVGSDQQDGNGITNIVYMYPARDGAKPISVSVNVRI